MHRDHLGNRLVNVYIRIIEYTVKKYGIKNKHVLDVACGTGNLPGVLGVLFQTDFHCAGSDLSEDMIAIARQAKPHFKILH